MRNSLLEVTPVIPGSLARLPELAANLFFSWHRPTRALFEDLDPELWKQTNGNPRLMLRCVNQETLERTRAMRATSARYRQALETLDTYLSPGPPSPDHPWSRISAPSTAFTRACRSTPAASACSPGTTARPRAMSAPTSSPSVCCTSRATSPRRVDNDGVQHAEYRERDPRDLPVEPVRDASGEWLA